jgi:hypothetical protein
MLSQDEIDEIMAEMEKQGSFNETKEQLSLFEGYDYTSQPLSSEHDLTVKLNMTCDHDWKVYHGLKDTDTYCTKCNEIKK